MSKKILKYDRKYLNFVIRFVDDDIRCSFKNLSYINSFLLSAIPTVAKNLRKFKMAYIKRIVFF